MPTYTFRNKKTDEKYDKIMSYEEMLKYKKQSNIEQVFVAPKIFKLNDVGGAEDNFRQWCGQPADNIDISKSRNFRQSKKEYMYGDKKDTDKD
jgi:hypothetical protein|tara:strand:- start:1595 stop:1873 length:279 start_codon:yes stop_codon:yes gene_type:complete